MTQPISELLAAAAQRAVPVIRGLPDDRLGGPTPCSEYTVAGLANHLFQGVVNFRAVAEKEEVDLRATAELLNGAWRERFADETRRLAEAWAAPGAEEGVLPGLGLPARVGGLLILLDLTLHAWDLARATGQEYKPAPETLPELRGLMDMMGPRAREGGAFAEPVDVPADAGEFDRLLGSTGRDPSWLPHE